MAKTYLDQIVEFPSNVIRSISNDKNCVGLILNKKISDITEDDLDAVIDGNLFDYQYVDNTTQETSAYVWVEMEVSSVQNKQIKGIRLYVTVACHKDYMKLNSKTFRGIMGNRRDNIVRYIDRLLNNSPDYGIGTLSLVGVRTLPRIGDFAVREMIYAVPDFNIVSIDA